MVFDAFFFGVREVGEEVDAGGRLKLVDAHGVLLHGAFSHGVFVGVVVVFVFQEKSDGEFSPSIMKVRLNCSSTATTLCVSTLISVCPRATKAPKPIIAIINNNLFICLVLRITNSFLFAWISKL